MSGIFGQDLLYLDRDKRPLSRGQIAAAQVAANDEAQQRAVAVPVLGARLDAEFAARAVTVTAIKDLALIRR